MDVRHIIWGVNIIIFLVVIIHAIVLDRRLNKLLKKIKDLNAKLKKKI